MSLPRRFLALGLGALGVLGGGGAALWVWLRSVDDPMARVRKAAARLLPPDISLDADAASEGPEGMVLEGLQLSGGETKGRATRAVLSGDTLRLEGVEIAGGGGILVARLFSLYGIDWERGLVRAGEAEDVAIADAGRLGGAEASRARLLGWSAWVPTRIELDQARLAVRGGRASGLDVSASSAVLSLDPGAAEDGGLAMRWIQALSAASLRGVSGTVAGQIATAEKLDVRLVARDQARKPSGVEIRATGLDIGGAVAVWREQLFYARMGAEGSLRAVRAANGEWRADVTFSWPLAGEGEASLEATSADGVWPDLSALRWRRLSAVWRDAGLARRVVEQARDGKTTGETAMALADILYGSALLEGAISARLDLERWLEAPGVVRLEMTGEGPVADLVRIVDLARPGGALVRLGLR